ncbi:MAG TPA: thiol:disulfide interchange protein DsbG [Steroidobacteraceae bacterium]|jgi:thiol:disulfide interchange protein DsbG
MAFSISQRPILRRALQALLGAALLCAGSLQAAPPWNPQSDAGGIWARLQRAAWVAQGSPHPQHMLYMITDANCPFCHDLWQSLQPYYGRHLQVRYVMVGILTRDSPGKAAAILEAPKPSAALDRNEKRWARLPEDLGGGMPAAHTPRPETLAAIAANETLMHDLGIRGTPALIYRDAAHALHVVQSTPDPARLKLIVDAAAVD